MPVTIDGSTGITAPAFDGAVDGADLTGSVSASLLTGTLPALNGSALTNLPAPTSAQVGTATAGLAYGDVGSYGLFYCGTTISPGSTIAGSSLQPANTYQSGSNWGGATVYGAPSGTWRIMGQTGYYTGTLYATTANVLASVFMRIS